MKFQKLVKNYCGCSNHLNLEMEAECLMKNLSKCIVKKSIVKKKQAVKKENILTVFIPPR